MQDTKPPVVILLPELMCEDASNWVAGQIAVSQNDDRDVFTNEMEGYCRELGYNNVCTKYVTLLNYREVVDSIDRNTLIFQLCDGTEDDGVVGLSLVKYLQELGRKFTGAKSSFYEITTTKERMKLCFTENHVPTAEWLVLSKINESEYKVHLPTSDSRLYRLIRKAREDNEDIFPIQVQLMSGSCTEVVTKDFTPLVNFPAFVKLNDSYGSIGIDGNSVCLDVSAVKTQVDKLLDGGAQSVIVEPFLEGAEYTILVVGDKVFPPVEKELGKEGHQTFESVIKLGCRFLPVEAELATRLEKIALDAFRAVEGNGYGRVDVKASQGSFYVLEVNSNCGLGENSSVGKMFEIYGLKMIDLVKDITDALS